MLFRSCNGLGLSVAALPISSVGEALAELTAPGDPHISKVYEPNVSNDGNGVPPGPSSPSLLDELLNNFSCTAPLSLLDTPIQLQLEGSSTNAGRRSVRLDKKNKICNIPIAKRAEFRLAEAFGDLPKENISKKPTEEDVQEKMKTYLWMSKKPTTPTAIQAIRELVEANV